jgi:hypothetical protein
MIFKQWELVLIGRKTQTRRLYHPDDIAEWTVIGKGRMGFKTSSGRWRYWIGQQLPIIPKRAASMVWYKRHSLTGHLLTSVNASMSLNEMKRAGYTPARINIVELRRERLQSISEEDAVAEGVESVAAYRELWESINGKQKGARWEDNPLVDVIVFSLVEAVVAAHD